MIENQLFLPLKHDKRPNANMQKKCIRFDCFYCYCRWNVFKKHKAKIIDRPLYE